MKCIYSKYMHVVMLGHTWSRDNDGGNIIRSAITEMPMLHANFMALFYRTGVIANESFTLWDLYAPVTSTLTQRPSYMNLTHIPWCVKMNLLYQNF